MYILHLQTPLQTPLPGTAQTPLPGTVQTPLPGTAQTPLPGTADSSSMYNIPTGGSTPFTPNEYSSLNDTGGATQLKGGPGRPSPFMVGILTISLLYSVQRLSICFVRCMWFCKIYVCHMHTFSFSNRMI